MNRLKTLILICLLLFICTACVGRAAAPGADPGQAEPLDADVAPPDEVPPAEPDGEPEAEVEPEPEPEPEEPYVRIIDPAKPMVALTFDDGPDGVYSNQILDILVENHALATFFEVGGNVWAYPEPVARMAELGCEVASHSNAHKDLSKMRKSTLLADLDAADEAFTAAGVDAPFLVRPPYGAVNKNVKTATGRAIVTWTVDTEDWRSRDAQTVIDYVKNYGNLDGEIILMHSIYSSTVEAARELVPWLQEQGYQLVTVTELLAFYYGELPEANHFYGYTYFTTHERTDTPVELPSMFPPVEAEETGEADNPEEAAAPDTEAAEPEAAPEPSPVEAPEETPAGEPDIPPTQDASSGIKTVSNPGVPNPATFNP